MAAEESEQLLIEQARDRARLLLGAVGGDLDALRAAASEAVYADGAAVCEDVAEAVRQFMAELDLAAAAPVDPTSPETPTS